MKISLQEVKNAMKDIKFRLSLGNEFKLDVQSYENNPTCLCNAPIYKRILKLAQKQLREYYGKDSEIEEINENLEKLAENNFSVINCHVNDLETKLRNLPNGRKQIAIARYQDQVTVVVNELNIF